MRLCPGHPCAHDILHMFADMGIKAVELNYLGSTEFTKLPTILNLKPFDYVSLHAPVLPYGQKDNALVELALDRINFINKSRKLDAVVFHPDPVVDFRFFQGTGINWAVENMDRHKKYYHSPEEIWSEVAELSDIGFVFDINHARSNGMVYIWMNVLHRQDSQDFLRHRLKHIHLSGYENHHEPLFQTRQDGFIIFAKSLEVPIIIESVVSVADLKKEYDYVMKVLNPT